MNLRYEINEYLSGKKLIGDNYTEEEILKWYEEEKNAYANLVDSRGSYSYEYHALNKACGFRFLHDTPPKSIRACGFGSAFGDELLPIRDKISTTVLVDSASSFHQRSLPVGVSTVLANPSGKIDADDESFDLITCFGVLHHIPNVSFVMSEFYRCLAPGGTLLVREPTTSMGDWRLPRSGVTKNERGIPSRLFNEIILVSGFQILKRTSCVFPPLAVICRKIGISPYNAKVPLLLDLMLSKWFSWNYNYHRTSFLSKLAPASDFYVCRKSS